jgi:hypothetical protein
MSGSWPAATGDPGTPEPSGLSASAVEIARGTAERDADLRAERRLLVWEVIIIVAIAAILTALQAVTP